MIRTVIADDHPVVRNGLKSILAAAGDLEVAAEAASCEELLAVLEQTCCDVVVLDISMPGRSGLEAVAAIRKEYPALAILILTIHPEWELGLRAVKAGVLGYLQKDTAAELLVTAVRAVASGQRFLTPELAARVKSSTASGGRADHERLSPREFEVFRLIASGRTVSEIAAQLKISVKTASTHRTRLMAKMQIHSTADLVRYAVDHRIVV
jgi:DNA-binding NarL/FixJ family response regulator